MDDLMLPLPGLSPVGGKVVVARFDGGCLSSDAGVLVLRATAGLPADQAYSLSEASSLQRSRLLGRELASGCTSPENSRRAADVA